MSRKTVRANRVALGLTGSAPVESQEVLQPHERLAEQYRQLFLSETGEAVLDDLRQRFGTRRSYVPDSNATAFHEGQRDVYLMILAYIQSDINRSPED